MQLGYFHWRMAGRASERASRSKSKILNARRYGTCRKECGVKCDTLQMSLRIETEIETDETIKIKIKRNEMKKKTQVFIHKIMHQILMNHMTRAHCSSHANYRQDFIIAQSAIGRARTISHELACTTRFSHSAFTRISMEPFIDSSAIHKMNCNFNLCFTAVLGVKKQIQLCSIHYDYLFREIRSISFHNGFQSIRLNVRSFRETCINAILWLILSQQNISS